MPYTFKTKYERELCPMTASEFSDFLCNRLSTARLI